MRVCISSKKARKGNRVRFHAALRGEMKTAFCQPFASFGDGEPSPYVPANKVGAKMNGQPMMINSTVIRLSPAQRSYMLELVAEENCRFYLMQDIDVNGDATVKGKVEIYGWLKQTLDSARRRLGRDKER